MPEETTRSDRGREEPPGSSTGPDSATPPPEADDSSEAPAEPSDSPTGETGAGDAATGSSSAATGSASATTGPPGATTGSTSVVHQTGRFVKELVIIVAIALVASALLRAFVVQAFFVPSGSMLPTIQLNDRILVSRIGDIHRGEVVVFEDPGGWIPADEQAAPPGKVRKALEFVGVLPASGHEHLVKRVIGLPGDHVVCCVNDKIAINGKTVDESDFIQPGEQPADNVKFDVIVPKDHIFVLGDNRYVSGDSSRHLVGQDAFIPEDLVTGRAFAIIWPWSHRTILHIPAAYDDVPAGQTPPKQGVINPVRPREGS